MRGACVASAAWWRDRIRALSAWVLSKPLTKSWRSNNCPLTGPGMKLSDVKYQLPSFSKGFTISLPEGEPSPRYLY